MLRFSALLPLATAVSALCLPAQSAHAITLLSDGGSFGQVAIDRNDDESSNLLDLPFSINFYGQSFSQFYVNNNGNITFGSPLSEFTPFNLGNLDQAMIAPYWADVDTRNPASGLVYVGSFAPGQLNVTWDNVGYFSSEADKLNSFQLNLYQVGDNGDFDIEFRYDRLEWTTGAASSGINGLGGIPAVAGFTNGDGVSVLQPGSFLSPGALNMAVESNTSPEEPGRWVYNIRNDSPPPVAGATPENPILPTGGSPEEGYEFTFNVVPDRVFFIDPPVATGYDFSATGGMLFTSAVFTSPLTDLDGYQLFSADGLTLLGSVNIGDTFNFAAPLDAFLLRGINPANLLNPADPLAFVSGFTFDSAGQVTVTQTPFVENFDPPSGAIPEPATWAMMILGFGMTGAALRRRRSVTVRFA